MLRDWMAEEFLNVCFSIQILPEEEAWLLNDNRMYTLR